MKSPLHRIISRALFCLAAFSIALPASAIEKPIGTFSSSGGSGTGIYTNPNLRGVLIRTSWKDLEPTNGNFVFPSALTTEINTAESNGVSWSLAVAGGGTGSPAWLTDPVSQGGLGAPYILYSFRGVSGYKLPLFWNSIVQTQLQQLATRLAQEYNNNPNLKLVYVTQMTANGIEGHLQGVSQTDLNNAGYTDALWITAGKDASKSFANAFTNKAVAFEVHEINGGTTVPSTIINDLWNDATLGQRVGAGMWWISGKTTYQPNLITVLTNFPGDIYGQIIGKSGEGPWTANTNFALGDYRMPVVPPPTNRFRYEVTTDGGSSGNTQPNWPTTVGQTVQD